MSLTTVDITTFNDYEKKGKLKSGIHPYYNLSIWNYQEIVHFQDSWDPITLMSRSLVIEKVSGIIIARGFPKFFNDTEKKHKPTDNFRVFDKADGSLGILFYYENEWIFASRGSFISEQAITGKKMLESLYPNYINLDRQHSYIFEIIYPENRIVVNYGEERKLVFLASFKPDGTEVMNREIMQELGFDLIEEFDFSNLTLQQLKDMNTSNREGFVIRYDTGERVKVKFEDYLILHKRSTNLTTKDVIQMYKSGKPLEESLVNIPDEMNDWVRNIFTELDTKCETILSESKLYIEQNKHLLRREFFNSIKDHQYRKIIAAIYLENNDSKIKEAIYSFLDVKAVKTKSVGFKDKPRPKKTATVIFLIGRSGSGKSTWTKNFVNGRNDCLIVNRDSIRKSLFSINTQKENNDYYLSPKIQSRENIVNDIAKTTLMNGIKDNMTIIFDNTNLEKAYIEDILDLISPDIKVTYNIIGSELSVNELHERTKSDGRFSVEKNIIKKQTDKFNKLLPELENIFNVRKSKCLIQDSNLPKSTIFDIDGTLALNLSGRSPYDMSRVDEDLPNERVIEFAKILKEKGEKIIICSGRENDGMQLTLNWLKKYDIEFDEIYMRKKGDGRKDFVIKEEFWRDIIKKYYVVNMFDDRDQVVTHGRKLGFNVYQVAEGNF